MKLRWQRFPTALTETEKKACRAKAKLSSRKLTEKSTKETEESLTGETETANNN